MRYISTKFVIPAFLFLAVTSLSWCVYRDIHIEKQYPGDLRNRVVGSRMQMDGLSPYFYHWKPAYGIRYYDWDNFGTTLKISNVTATPFFHQLLYPIANLPQRTISKLWLLAQYLALLVITLLALQFAKGKKQKLAVWVISLLFLYSYAWLTGIGMGQLYILIPLVAMLFYYFITRKPVLSNAVFAGISAGCLLLIRPNTVLFLLPFLLLANRYTLNYKLTLFTSFCVILLLAFSSSHSRMYWSNYFEAMKEQVKFHQDTGPARQISPAIPVFNRYEGWDRVQIKEAENFPFYKHSEEHGNVFVLLNAAMHVKTPLWVLSALCSLFMMLICLLFFQQHWPPSGIDACSIALLGFLIYMASDLFSPVHRWNYNASQWIFPLLLAAGSVSTSYKRIFVAGIFTGLLLNSLGISLFPMEHTLGEYMIYGSLLGLLLTFKPQIRA